MNKEITIAENEIYKIVENQELYLVLINNEEQYSLWPNCKSIPEGWKLVKKESTKDECLAYVDKYWTDMRPLSLKKRIKELQK